MKKAKAILALALTLMLAFSFAACGKASTEETESTEVITLTAGHADSTESIFQFGLEAFKTKLEELSGGTMTVNIYPSGQLGTLKETLDQVRMGTCDIAPIGYSVLASYASDMGVLDLPFLWDSYEHVNNAFAGELGSYFASELANSGLEVVGWFSQGFREVTSKPKIETLADMQNLKIRVMSSDVYTQTFTALGCAPMSVDFSELFAALQQGTVDGQENPMAILLAVQIEQYHKHLTLWNYLIDPLVLYWNKREWERFPPDVQDAIRTAANEATRYEKALVRAGLDDGQSQRLLEETFHTAAPVPDPVATLEARGVTVTRLTAAEIEAFRAATAAVTEKWIPRIGTAVVEAARADMQP